MCSVTHAWESVLRTHGEHEQAPPVLPPRVPTWVWQGHVARTSLVNQSNVTL